MSAQARGSLIGDYLAHPRHGPLPALLLLLTVGTGVVDAVSILSLGRVFVANMTGNVVFLGFALAGASGFALGAALLALAGFLAGAAAGGSMVGRLREHRGRLFAIVTTAELVLLVAALTVAVPAGEPYGTGPRNGIAFLAALAMGLQNAAARELAVPDATTTVLTMTLTGFAADLRQRNGRVVLRRLLAVVAMLVGAVVGALLVLGPGPTTALVLVVALLTVVAAAGWAAARRPAAWHRPG